MNNSPLHVMNAVVCSFIRRAGVSLFSSALRLLSEWHTQKNRTSSTLIRLSLPMMKGAFSKERGRCGSPLTPSGSQGGAWAIALESWFRHPGRGRTTMFPRRRRARLLHMLHMGAARVPIFSAAFKSSPWCHRRCRTSSRCRYAPV